ncbi:MAG: hypothetical protein V7644_338 [Actinomycetota bacterium]|jgi:predicted RNA-binding protein YlxR (DUF448 family)
MTEPLRRCVACGRRAPQGELLRFAARDGQLVAARGGSGRGAYTCRRLVCFERAQAQRGFARTLRQQVRVDPGLARLYTEES